MAEIEGGCLCGAVRYKASGDPLFMANCHCDDCRKSSAAGHMSLMGFTQDNLNLTGDLTNYEMKADSGATVTHHFCPKCGSQVYNNTTNAPQNVALVAATLDNPEAFSPQAVVFASKAAPWDPPAAGVPHFPKMPPSN